MGANGRRKEEDSGMSRYKENAEFVKNFLDEGGLRYEMQEAANSVLFSGSIAGSNGLYDSFKFFMFVEDHLVQNFAMFPAVALSKMPDVVEFITRVNYNLVIGGFEMDYENGKVRYHMSVPMSALREERDDLLPRTLFLPVEMLDRYAKGLAEVILGLKAPLEAIAECEVGCDGAGDSPQNGGVRSPDEQDAPPASTPAEGVGKEDEIAKGTDAAKAGDGAKAKEGEEDDGNPKVEDLLGEDDELDSILFHPPDDEDDEEEGFPMEPHKKPKFTVPEPVRDYSLDGLSIRGDIPLPKVVAAVKNFYKMLKDGTSPLPDRPRMNLLLWGPPGTGKSEFVAYLGQQLGSKVSVKMASDILSRFVGSGERAIRRMFKEAEKAGAILFLDEIDGVMQDRSGAKAGWEVTQVNELLDCMENFSGVMIGATNFMDHLDAAVMRRFTYKLEFGYLEEEGKRWFFERAFKTPLTASESRRLDAIPNLTPGDFKTVSQKLYYIGDNVGNGERLEALEQEVALKRDANHVCQGFAA